MPLTPFGTYESWDIIIMRIRWADNLWIPLSELLVKKMQNNAPGTFSHDDAERQLVSAQAEIESAQKLRDFFDLDGELIISEKMANAAYKESET